MFRDLLLNLKGTIHRVRTLVPAEELRVLLCMSLKEEQGPCTLIFFLNVLVVLHEDLSS